MTIDKPAWAAESYVDQRWLCHDLRMGEVMAARRDELTPDGMEPGELIIFVGPNGTASRDAGGGGDSHERD